MTVDQARREAKTVLGKIARGIDPPDEKQAGDTITIGEICEGRSPRRRRAAFSAGAGGRSQRPRSSWTGAVLTRTSSRCEGPERPGQDVE